MGRPCRCSFFYRLSSANPIRTIFSTFYFWKYIFKTNNKKGSVLLLQTLTPSTVSSHQTTDMLRDIEFRWNVTFPTESLDKMKPFLKSSIVTRLLQILLCIKSTKEHGYFLAITNLKSIGKAEACDEYKNILFPIVFNCRTFIPVVGEILQGLVHNINRNGVFVKCGPIRNIYLSVRKMPGYRYVDGEEPVFLSNELSKIGIGVVLIFKVISVRWVKEHSNSEIKREFQMLASLKGDLLGPVSLSGSDEFDL